MKVAQDMRLCAILERMGKLHSDQMQEAIELQQIRPKRIGQVLLDLGFVDEDDILEALSEQFGIPFEKNLTDDVDTSITTRVPISFIREYEMVPIRQNGEAFYVAVHNPETLLPMEDLRLLLGGPVEPILCRKADI